MTSRPTTKIPRSELNSLRAFYQLPQEENVLEYLEHHQHLLLILEQGKTIINDTFPNFAVYLEVVTDPDSGESLLAIYIKRQEEDVEIALDLIEKVYDEWLAKYNAEVRSQLLLRYDYR
ncbi:hypothetical protein PCC7424_5468 (plasmid) [Gloeothece citriformis PCC 7424]|uniref:Uncharacterized protein n=1 Tax=Gloeothece citriformis (strain PCC 7424) TaxID=65393 RepID=B7KLR8_GLOC7|nr:hypothetical protein [Gloeothece citriformis]ACK73740.1 hypothetical protein PCC7424_5673 [Gloeothece citriformis PCC 7424]ACK74039.1 hypothetical protein PCC7424_5468 [Gloeothece citriformis PCC 7424]